MRYFQTFLALLSLAISFNVSADNLAEDCAIIKTPAESQIRASLQDCGNPLGSKCMEVSLTQGLGQKSPYLVTKLFRAFNSPITEDGPFLVRSFNTPGRAFDFHSKLLLSDRKYSGKAVMTLGPTNIAVHPIDGGLRFTISGDEAKAFLQAVHSEQDYVAACEVLGTSPEKIFRSVYMEWGGVVYPETVVIGVLGSLE